MFDVHHGRHSHLSKTQIAIRFWDGLNVLGIAAGIAAVVLAIITLLMQYARG